MAWMMQCGKVTVISGSCVFHESTLANNWYINLQVCNNTASNLGGGVYAETNLTLMGGSQVTNFYSVIIGFQLGLELGTVTFTSWLILTWNPIIFSISHFMFQTNLLQIKITRFLETLRVCLAVVFILPANLLSPVPRSLTWFTILHLNLRTVTDQGLR